MVFGYDTFRKISIKGDEWSKEDARDWSNDHSHDYKGTTLSFRWTPGKELHFLMQGSWRYAKFGLRTWFIKQSIPGPLPTWRVYKRGEVEHAGSKLTFEILDCPGPPREMFKPVPLP